MNIDHFKSKEHINNSNKNIEIRTKKSIEEKFIDIIFKFKITTKDAFYNDLYFTKVAKQKVRENMIKDKKYKYNITFRNGVLDNINNKLTDYKISYNPEDIFEAIDTAFRDMHMLNSIDVKDDNNDKTELTQKEIVKKDKERLRVNEVISKQNEEKLLEENFKLMETIKKVELAEIKEWLLENGENENEITDKFIQEQRNNYFDFLYGNSNVIREYNEDGTYELVGDNSLDSEDLDEFNAKLKKTNIKSGASNATEYNYELTIKLTEYIPISGGNISELNKILDLFLNKRKLLVLKNNDEKCFLYCYIREFLNPITRNKFRITKRDKELADKIINETNLNFENVSISEIDKIEKKSKVNVNVFSCNKNYKNKNPVRKSRDNYDKILNLLLIEDINHYIIIKNLHCFLTDRCPEKDNFICKTCLNIFYSEIKYNEHISYCKIRKSQRLMPSNEKYIKFNKLQNCMLNNFVIYSDFECIIDKNNEHKFISGGYLLKCKNDKFSKSVQIFNNLDDYCENLKNELKYIEKINSKHLNYKIDMKTFD